MIDISRQIVMKPINEIKPYVRNPRKNEKNCKAVGGYYSKGWL